METQDRVKPMETSVYYTVFKASLFARSALWRSAVIWLLKGQRMVASIQTSIVPSMKLNWIC